MRTALMVCLVLVLAGRGFGEELFREGFDGVPAAPPLRHTWGDAPARLDVNAVQAGPAGSPAAHLQAVYPETVAHKLSYWSYRLPTPLPLIPHLETLSFRVKTNAPVSIKIGLAPFGFIYHGPGVAAAEGWQTVTLPNAYAELAKWCAGGQKRAEDGYVESVIIALSTSAGLVADVWIDDIGGSGPEGARQAVDAERLARRQRRVKVAAVSLLWEEGRRTLAEAQAALDEAGKLGADLVCLPQECVDQPPEPIPGPAALALAAKAAEYRMYVVGNLREQAGDKVYITSFLCDRSGAIAGTYRKSHHLPYEDDFALGDDLPTFATDFGCLGLKIGTDHFFPEIDTVLRRRGASLVVWSTKPFPCRDEHIFSLAVQGRAQQNGLHLVVAQYAGLQGFGGYAERFSWTASWPLGRAQVYGPDGHTLADSGHAGGVALATIPRARLGGSPGNGGYSTEGTFGLIASGAPLPAPPRGEKRVIRAGVIECEPNLDRLVAKLDECGKQGCDLVCLWEYVWYHTDAEVEANRERNRGYLARLADAARRHAMYVLVAGELERGFNESILFDRQGQELGRYTKILQTTARTSKYYREGDRVGVFDLDFGRICTKICNDVNGPDIDRVAALHQVDLMLLSTQDAGPYSEAIRRREAHRCVDCGYFLLRAASSASAETDHRSYIMDPWGMVLAGSQMQADNPPLIVTLNLDNRPRYHEWPEAVRRAGDLPDPVKRGIPEKESLKMYGRFNRPQAKGDLRAVVLSCRRPELYRPRPSP